ncbi:hypothetical protein I204_07551 [Kwoniella mangroviensis CBS 8886]|uniref:hypothetical protein n=1 Tax=Kwoniella mangroviensis CBS 8507 TaxID=1296122 RepID=UPI00080D2EBE|nr:uncharacterized protein I203_08026 [Kwoniella mangroviensis CBS 8507]OCF62892.1 hypothetical protein I203_08026 [Kwoniella mangroviensis CBS 8507]OCF71493.1 hypothetical protein I204_07551 [Kwoniella mangroviensis CBS 8886]
MTPSGTPSQLILKSHSPPSSPSSSSPYSPLKDCRPLFALTQSLPDDLKLQIFDILSTSFQDLKTLTRLSQNSYDRYAPSLYKRLHIKSYDVPIKMRLMNPKYRKGYHPFTQEDEKAYKRYKERRMGIMEYCESLRFVNENDIRATLGLVCEFFSGRKIPESDECSNGSTARVFGNVKYLIFQGKCSIMNSEIAYKDSNKVYSSKLLWKMLNPTHICIDDSSIPDDVMSLDFSTLEYCRYLQSNRRNWTDISSATLHSIVHGVVKFDEKVDQRIFFKAIDRSRPHPQPRRNHRQVVLNEDYLTTLTVLSRTSDDDTTKKIEILNCPNNSDDVLLHRQLEGLSPIDGVTELFGGEEGEACVCCGKR